VKEMEDPPKIATDARKKKRDYSGSQKAADALLMIALIAIAATYIGSRWSSDDSMPEKVLDSAEVDLYLIPGGAYTSADIIANGSQTASEKFKAFQAKHDFKPKVGDAICPITRTKANPTCSWIIGGNEYLFCCPPCIDEFLLTAKSSPTSIKSPSDYVQGSK